MGDAERLNDILKVQAPAIARCLSPAGRAAVFPRGIPFQAAAASGTEINATIGQLTDGHGGPMPLPEVARHLDTLEAKRAFLYSPIEGPDSLRRLWRERQLRLAGRPHGTSALPFVTHGLTHGIQVLAGLFSDADTEIVVPTPCWGNYGLIFRLTGGARLRQYPFFNADNTFNIDGLADALEQVSGKAIVILNFPNNPTGYSPTAEEAQRIVDVVTAHRGPAVIVSDDAYLGWVYEPNRVRQSLYWALAERADLDRHFPVKVDGATKELVFFASRVGFLTYDLHGEAAEALLSKLKCLVRGTVGSAPGPSMAVMEAALRSPGLEASFALRREQMQERYEALRDGLASIASPALVPYPFNSAFFALVQLTGGRDADTLRQRLIDEYSVGTVAFPEHNALRIAFCSIHTDAVHELVSRLEKALQ